MDHDLLYAAGAFVSLADSVSEHFVMIWKPSQFPGGFGRGGTGFFLGPPGLNVR